MKVVMLRSHRASPDGFRIQYYKAGMVYNLPNMLARMLCSHGFACQIK